MSDTPPTPEPTPAELAALDREETEFMRLRLAVPDWLRENPALGLTALYLGASLIGVLFHFLLLRRFGFNVLEFSETSDFLMVVVREPLTVALALLGVPFYLVYGRVSLAVGAWVRRRFPALRRSPEKRRQTLEQMRRWWPTLQAAFIIVYAVLFVMVYSLWRASRIRAGDHKSVLVEYKTDSPRPDGTLRSEGLALLGTTGRFVFFYDPKVRRAEAVPLDAIARLSWDARSRRERQADAAAAPTEWKPPAFVAPPKP